MKEQGILDRIHSLYREILGDKLVGIYIHGSLAFGCFCWERSDIDFLAVVDRALSQLEKEAIIRALLDLDKDCPPKGLEMSVLLEEACRDFCYPTPFELHFSNAHKEWCRADLKGYCRAMRGTDKDLAAHITVIHKAGIVLCGKDIGEVFGTVPREDYLDSIQNDIRNAVDEVVKDPVYVILNLCRVLAYLREDLVLSKAQGGSWGLEHLPEIYHAVIRSAGRSYSGEGAFSESEEAARRFAAYLLEQIVEESKNRS